MWQCGHGVKIVLEILSFVFWVLFIYQENKADTPRGTDGGFCCMRLMIILGWRGLTYREALLMQCGWGCQLGVLRRPVQEFR